MTILRLSPSRRKSTGVDLAVRLVSDLYEAMNRPDLSDMIRNGHAEDFPELKVAAMALCGYDARIERYEDALSQYADPGFWDDSLPGGALAAHDQGIMARNVLAGRTAFFHRD
ncbi:hypothetical protein N6H05_12535 [Sphingobium sp. WTD-1]|jgi:hypothetical protein|uniref:hypothetical protein n=1 Tax=Sphingobium sp. WTD-1 TaxID=2979467 RepID=UPI0024DE1207|nr:hypothetical protein [Sphingobium sp. WTD-1]WIA58568.1 hypothetical protein N6H05_12535 [Sphingobium sp. WTD-1]